MVSLLEKLLWDKTKDTQSHILYAQWKYDKEVIPSALQAVSVLFPHYSLHDESHSVTIINNIVRIIGKGNLYKLSAIDIWLLLEASYSHDIGMVVSSKELIQSISSVRFIEFFKDLLSDTNNSLHEFARAFEIRDGQIHYKSSQFDFKSYDGIKFILAEYFRRIHADRSKDTINNPSEYLDVRSPRGVIPPRIFKMLGDISSVHTKDFKEVMKLPFCEIGIDIEDAHPRFIACMLRIGDLLDLDNNRFSEVMLRTLSRVPVDTVIHKNKHLSIESFRVGNDVVEITARCKEYEAANVTQHWFNYLDTEIRDQTMNWNHIVPSDQLGSLPMIGDLKVELKDYDYIDGKNKPKFTVDTDRALELLQGAGLYDSPYQCIRELLQNAVDATLIKIWLDDGQKLKYDSPQDPKFLARLQEHPITFSIREKEEKPEGDTNNPEADENEKWSLTVDPHKGKHKIDKPKEDNAPDKKKKIWIITIADKGIGLSANDLSYLMHTGSSSKNKEKSRIIDKMPAWMQPSGNFGIGFQSIFMITRSVTITTKSYLDEGLRRIELNSPHAKKRGAILVQKGTSNYATRPGVKLSFELEADAVPDRYSISHYKHANAERLLRNFDPFTKESLDFEVYKIIDELIQFGKRLSIPVRVQFLEEKFIIGGSGKRMFKYFDPETSLELNAYVHDQNDFFERVSTVSYKSQEIKDLLSWDITPFVKFDINIHGKKASDVLTLNRNEIRDSYGDELKSNIVSALYRFYVKSFDKLETENEKQMISMFMEYHKNDKTNQSNCDVSRFREWEQYSFRTTNGKDITIKEILSLTHLILKDVLSLTNNRFELDQNSLTIITHLQYAKYPDQNFLVRIARNHFQYISYEELYEGTDNLIKLSKEKIGDVVSEKYLAKLIGNLDQLQKDHFSFARHFIPCIGKLNRLRVKWESQADYVRPYIGSRYYDIVYPKMLSPYISHKDVHEQVTIKEALNDKVYDWVYENRYHESTTREQIIEGYRQFMEEFPIDGKEENTSEDDTGIDQPTD